MYDYERKYEAALGTMLVRFNELEVKFTVIVRRALEIIGASHLYSREARYIQNIEKMEIAHKAINWPTLDYARMRRINTGRNRLAHGHLDRDQQTGEFSTIPANKKATGKNSGFMSIEDIESLTEEIRAALLEVADILPNAWFDEPEDVYSVALAQTKAKLEALKKD